MIFRIMHGVCELRFCPEDVALGVDEPKTIAFLSMQSFGFYGQALHGETFHRNMVAGKILIVVFVVGVIKVHGNMSLRIRWICRISSG